MKHDIFISFSFVDQKVAENVVNLLLSEHGISSWICTRDVGGGVRYKNLITEAIDIAKAVVFIQSSASIRSKEVPKEIGIAFEQDKPIIPFRIDDTRLEGDLRYDLHGVNYIDGTIPTFEDRVRDLAISIKKILKNEIAVESDEQKHVKSNHINTIIKSTPYGCSEIFYGRDSLIEQIFASYEKRNTVFLYGMGGIGKSEIAKQYARRFRKFYSTIIFAHYEGSLAALIADDNIFCVDGVARKTTAGGELQSDEEYAVEKLSIIRSIADKHMLIILDNFDVAEDPFLELVAVNAPYHLLITSRLEPERGKFFSFPVHEIADESLKAMVMDFANPDLTMIDPEDPFFEELFILTHRHTLTLELLAKYMCEKCIDDVEQMVEILKCQRLNVLNDSEYVDRYGIICNLFRMTEFTEKEQYFMKCLSLLAPGGVLQKDFREWCGDAFRSRARLAALGMIQLNMETKTVALHPIVREVVITQLKPSLINCREFLDKFQESIYQSWNWSYSAKRSLEASCDSILNLIPLSNESFNLYYTFSILKSFVAGYHESMKILQNLYTYAEEHQGKNSLNAALVAYRAGWVSQFHDLDAMKLWLEECAYPIMKMNENNVLRELPQCLTNLGMMYIKKYDKDPQEKFLEKSQKFLNESEIRIGEVRQIADKNSIKGLEKVMYTYLCGVKMAKADLAILRQDFLKSKELLDEVSGLLPKENTADYAYLAMYYAKLYQKREDWSEAKTYWQEAEKRYEESFGENTIYSIQCKLAIANCSEKMNITAETYYNEAYKIAKMILTVDHPMYLQAKSGVDKDI